MRLASGFPAADLMQHQCGDGTTSLRWPLIVAHHDHYRNTDLQPVAFRQTNGVRCLSNPPVHMTPHFLGHSTPPWFSDLCCLLVSVNGHNQSPFPALEISLEISRWACFATLPRPSHTVTRA